MLCTLFFVTENGSIFQQGHVYQSITMVCSETEDGSLQWQWFDANGQTQTKLPECQVKNNLSIIFRNI